MRCVACNRLLTIFEERLVKQDGTPEDMCVICRKIAKDDLYVGELTVTDIDRAEVDFMYDDDDEDDDIDPDDDNGLFW